MMAIWKKMAVCFLVVICAGNALAKSPSYKKVLKTWTRVDNAYNREDSFMNMGIKATYFSSDYLDARLREYTRKFALTSEEKDAYWEKVLEPMTLQPTFFVAFYTRDKRWNTLQDISENPLWKLTLVQGDQPCEPSEITAMKPLLPEEAYFFPYVHRWDRFYVVKFPSICQLDETQAFELDVNGLYGKSQLRW